jgi:hypothetical protein
MTLCSREAKQPPRLRLVLASALPFEVHEPEAELRVSKPLRSCEAKQPPCLREVLRSALPADVHEPEAVLRVSKPLRSREANIRRVPSSVHVRLGVPEKESRGR